MNQPPAGGPPGDPRWRPGAPQPHGAFQQPPAAPANAPSQAPRRFPPPSAPPPCAPPPCAPPLAPLRSPPAQVPPRSPPAQAPPSYASPQVPPRSPPSPAPPSYASPPVPPRSPPSPAPPSYASPPPPSYASPPVPPRSRPSQAPPSYASPPVPPRSPPSQAPPSYASPPVPPRSPPSQAPPSYAPWQASPHVPLSPLGHTNQAVPVASTQLAMAPVPQDAHAFGAPVAGTGAPVPRVADSPGVVNARKVGHIRPRLGGLVLLVVALLLVGINVWTLYEEKKFYPKALLFAPMAACTGTWLLIVGQPVDERTGEVLLWSRLGTGASAALGLLLGAFATWFVGC